MSNVELGSYPSHVSVVPQDTPRTTRSFHDLRQPLSTLALQDKSQKLVDWDGPDDPEKPTNFSRTRKWIITMAMATLTLTVTFSSSVFSVAVAVTARLFHVGLETMVLGTALFVLGIGLGPMIWGPLSELYGRKISIFTSFFLFAIFQIPVAVAQNVQSVIIFRFLQGFAGSAPVVVVGGVLADVWDARERGFAVPCFAGALFAGPVLAPIMGAFITDSYLGWRWTQWITLIMAALFGIIAFVLVPETFAPVLLARKAKRLRHSTEDWAIHAKHEEKGISLKDIVESFLMRPSKMLVLEPILVLITLYLAFIYGLLYLFFEAFPLSYKGQRGWSAGVAGLPFIGIFLGVLSACTLISLTTKTRLAPNPQEGRPQETRLLLMILGGISLPVGLFWFAWTSNPALTPWPQIISGVPIGIGTMLITMQGLNYIIDCYTFNAASALAATTLVRSFFGAGFPLFATAMFDRLGVPWATSVLAFIAVALFPVPILFYRYGATIRTFSKYVPS